MGEVQRSVQSNTSLTKGFLLLGWFTMKGFCDFSRYEETQRLDNYLKTCSPVSLEHRVPHFPPWIPLRGCWRSTAAAAKGSIVTVQFSLLLPLIFPSIRVFSKESVLCIRWPSIGVSASASLLPVNIQDWFPLGWTGWISLQSKGLSRVFSNITVLQCSTFLGS